VHQVCSHNGKINIETLAKQSASKSANYTQNFCKQKPNSEILH